MISTLQITDSAPEAGGFGAERPFPHAFLLCTPVSCCCSALYLGLRSSPGPAPLLWALTFGPSSLPTSSSSSRAAPRPPTWSWCQRLYQLIKVQMFKDNRGSFLPR